MMLFTRKDNFIDMETVMNLLMWIGTSNEFIMPMPAVLKPKALWTGKQIFSMLIPNVNMVRFGDGEKNWCSANDSIILI
jgi:DNA-directed RNA polymerase II subunit RPB1